MGTSNSNKGTSGHGTPLIPSWLDAGDSDNGPSSPYPEPLPNGNGEPDGDQTGHSPMSPVLPPIPAPADADRFTNARNNFSRFVGSGGRNRANLGRAISGYVSRVSGGSRQAARRMGTSRRVGTRLLDFLSNAASHGTREALRSLNLEELAGNPIEVIFLGLADYICPEGGTVDDGIARDAFIQTITDLTDNGITNLDGLTFDQVGTVFELYVTHSIEAKLYNDIGNGMLVISPSVASAERIQTQLHDFIRHGVADAITAARAALEALTSNRISQFVDNIYRQAFSVLEYLGNAAANGSL